MPDIAKGFTDSVDVDTKLLESKKELSLQKMLRLKNNGLKQKNLHRDAVPRNILIFLVKNLYNKTWREGRLQAKKEVKEVSYISKQYSDFEKMT